MSRVLRSGLVGAHISRTRLPAALKIMCDAYDIELEYTLFDSASMADANLKAIVEQARHDGWTGLSVTHPFKSEARAIAARAMLPETAHLDACNTLVFDPVFKAGNSDFTGFLAAIELADLGPIGDVVMIGAGGVAKAIGPALASLGARVGIYDHRSDFCDALATSIGPRAYVLTTDELKGAISAADGLVNATPMGMVEYPGSAFDPDAFTPANRWAFDAVYTPPDTMFLQSAQRAGMHCISGFELFLAMAIHSFQLYTNISIPRDQFEERLRTLRPS